MLSLSEAKASLQSSGPHPAVEGFEGDRGGAVNDKNSGAAGNGSSFGAEAAAVLKGAKNDISNLVPTRLRIQLTPTKLALAPGSSSMLLETAHTQVGTGSGPASTSKLQQSAILLKDTGPILWPERGAVASSGPVDNDNNVDSWLVPNRQAPTKEAPVGVQSSRGHTGSGNVSFTPDAMQPHRASSSGSVNVLVVEQCGGSESSGLDDEELKGAYRVETKDANIHHSINQVAQVTLGAPVVAPITVQLAAPTVPHTHVRSAPADHAYGNTRGHAASGVHADTTLKHAFDDATDNEDDIRRGGGKHALAHPAAQDDAARHVPSPKAQQSQQQAPALHPSTAAAWSRFLSMTEAMIALMENSSMQLKQESVTPTEVRIEQLHAGDLLCVHVCVCVCMCGPHRMIAHSPFTYAVFYLFSLICRLIL